MNVLKELIELGFHDAEIVTMHIDLEKKNIEITLSILCNEVSKSDNKYESIYKDGVLTFLDVKSCKINGAYDFINLTVILEGEINRFGCNLYLSSDQRVIIKSRKVKFSWKKSVE